jgi:hypothetical protein
MESSVPANNLVGPFHSRMDLLVHLRHMLSLFGNESRSSNESGGAGENGAKSCVETFDMEWTVTRSKDFRQLEIVFERPNAIAMFCKVGSAFRRTLDDYPGRLVMRERIVSSNGDTTPVTLEFRYDPIRSYQFIVHVERSASFADVWRALKPLEQFIREDPSDMGPVYVDLSFVAEFSESMLSLISDFVFNHDIGRHVLEMDLVSTTKKSGSKLVWSRRSKRSVESLNEQLVEAGRSVHLANSIHQTTGREIGQCSFVLRDCADPNFHVFTRALCCEPTGVQASLRPSYSRLSLEIPFSEWNKVLNTPGLWPKSGGSSLFSTIDYFDQIPDVGKRMLLSFGATHSVLPEAAIKSLGVFPPCLQVEIRMRSCKSATVLFGETFPGLLSDANAAFPQMRWHRLIVPNVKRALERTVQALEAVEYWLPYSSASSRVVSVLRGRNVLLLDNYCSLDSTVETGVLSTDLEKFPDRYSREPIIASNAELSWWTAYGGSYEFRCKASKTPNRDSLKDEDCVGRFSVNGCEFVMQIDYQSLKSFVG